MSPRLARLLATVFVALVACPLTAPFACCDFSHLIQAPATITVIGAVKAEPNDATADAVAAISVTPTFVALPLQPLPAVERPARFVLPLAVLRL